MKTADWMLRLMSGNRLAGRLSNVPTVVFCTQIAVQTDRWCGIRLASLLAARPGTCLDVSSAGYQGISCWSSCAAANALTLPAPADRRPSAMTEALA